MSASTPPPKAPQRLTDKQAEGAFPYDNAWMSASAGTGKTQVLTARILRLLLSGVPPRAILAITFTKAGAAEMASRIREKLADWVQMKNNALQQELYSIHAPGHVEADMLSYARTLFARVIDAPGGGLAIQTIHSFCQSLLSAFPHEAGLMPGFRALDDRERSELQRDVLAELIVEARATGDLAFLDRLEMMALELGEAPATSYLFRCGVAAKALDGLPAGGIGPWLRGQFGLPTADAPDAWLVTACGALSALDQQAIRAIIAAHLAWGTPKGQGYAALLGDWLAATPERRAATIGDALSALCTKSGGLLAIYANPRQMGDVEDLAQRIAATLQTIRATARHIAASDQLAGALEAGRHFARAFAKRKQHDAVVDFDDLIDHMVGLLSSERLGWIRYKLDARIDHILVDEAQDTNLRQWEIIGALAGEFFAGRGAKEEGVRTLFVVGDLKQAIYGFQGTNPIFFEAARKRFAEAGLAADRPFNDVAIDTNFRSSPPILALVDAVIEQAGPAAFGLSEPVKHTADATHAPGRVTLWPLEPHGDADKGRADSDEEGWIDSATRRIAGKIGRTVRAWIDHGIDGAAVRPSDILVLVRKRSDIAALIVSRLLANAVPVAGVDRLRLQSPIAVQDLLSAIRFALQPHDDLNLASLLVSPLVGWPHDDLIEHGWRIDADGRFPVSLWRHLNRQDALAGRLEALHPLLRMAGYVGPFRFLETILSGPMRGRARLLARLGQAALDPIEELVSQALAFETREGPSLHKFLAWFDAGTQEVKRELEGGEEAVRVMTAHGAKGLQARIVILADAAVNPLGKRDDIAIWDSDQGAIPLLALRSGVRPDALERAIADKQAEEMREHHRLLYVAMTRAERKLFVAGAMPASGELPTGNWYATIEAAVRTLGAETRDDPVWGGALTYAKTGREDRTAGPTIPPALSGIEIPAWAMAPAPDEGRPARPLAPSAHEDLAELSVPLPPDTLDRDAAMRRGTLIHALFERLPASAPEQRRAAALRWLEPRTQAISESARAAMVDSVLSVLDDPAFAEMFGPDSLAEAPFSALVDGRVIAGTVDRLLVTDSDVRVIDYKSGRFVPASAAEVPVGYLRQMAAYVAALRVIFPAHRVSAALLFSEGPRLIELPETTIEQHKPKLQQE